MSCSTPETIGHDPVPPAVPSNRFNLAATSLAEMTTLGVGGPVSRLVLAESEAEIVETIREADDAGIPVLMIGGGSNILASDEAFDGVVVRDMRADIKTTEDDSCGGGEMIATAGVPWDDLVVYSLESEWIGLEALSGIPGSVGAAPVQNIGAYGQEVASTIASLRVYDRATQKIRTLFLSDLDFGYRHSLLKESMVTGSEGKKWGPSPRWIVLEVKFHLRRATLASPVQYGQLAKHLGVELGARVLATDLRQAVLELRRSKSMVLDDTDRNTYSAGSFFTNPVLTEEQATQLPEGAPRYGVSNSAAINQIGAAAPKFAGQVKTSAAWLIDHAGFPAGFNMPGPAALSTKHSLALTNRGGANAQDLVNLARTIRDGVIEKFGVTLVPEPVILGVEI
ncbi:MAG: UDP-N-acetylmuramate dehydrogenase [Actinomycetaceae bacterium]|nr:UDP-N-acetylmuramate dehydrogenase [Actinomycetaceae bacterium]